MLGDCVTGYLFIHVFTHPLFVCWEHLPLVYAGSLSAFLLFRHLGQFFDCPMLLPVSRVFHILFPLWEAHILTHSYFLLRSQFKFTFFQSYVHQHPPHTHTPTPSQIKAEPTAVLFYYISIYLLIPLNYKPYQGGTCVHVSHHSTAQCQVYNRIW